MMCSARTLPHSEPPLRLTSDDIFAAEEQPNLPIDRSQVFYPELYPRNPDAYEPLDHMIQQQNEPERLLRRPLQGFSAVRKTIYAGELRDNGDGCGVFHYSIDGIAFFVIVGFHKKGYRIAVTGWPFCYDQREAEQSERWRQDEIDTVVRFNQEHYDEKNQYNRFNFT